MATLTRTEQKAQTRGRLVDKAIEVFARDGLVTTRTIDIARAAGVSHGTVFLHFPTREDLLFSVLESFCERVARRMHELVGAKGSLREVLAAHLQGIEENEDFYARLVMEGHLLPKGARSMLIGIHTAISKHLGIVVKKEIKAGAIPPLPLHLVFNGWIGLVHRYLIDKDIFAPEGSVIARYGRELLDFYIFLLTKNPKGEI